MQIQSAGHQTERSRIGKTESAKLTSLLYLLIARPDRRVAATIGLIALKAKVTYRSLNSFFSAICNS